MLTIQETGKAGQALPDKDVLALACGEDRILLNLNRRHFVRLHEVQPDHAGIVTCSYDPDFTGQALRIHEAVAAVSARSALIRVNRPER